MTDIAIKNHFIKLKCVPISKVAILVSNTSRRPNF